MVTASSKVVRITLIVVAIAVLVIGIAYVYLPGGRSNGPTTSGSPTGTFTVSNPSTNGTVSNPSTDCGNNKVILVVYNVVGNLGQLQTTWHNCTNDTQVVAVGGQASGIDLAGNGVASQLVSPGGVTISPHQKGQATSFMYGLHTVESFRFYAVNSTSRVNVLSDTYTISGPFIVTS